MDTANTDRPITITLVTIIALLGISMPVMGMVAGALYLIAFPKSVAAPVVILATLISLVAVSSSKTVGYFQEDDLLRYYLTYSSMDASVTKSIVFGHYRETEPLLPALFYVLHSVFGPLGKQQFLLMLSVLIVSIHMVSVRAVGKALNLSVEELRVVLGASMLLFPTMMALQLLRQYLGCVTLLMLFAFSTGFVRVLAIAMSLLFHSASAISLLMLVSAINWGSVLIASIIGALALMSFDVLLEAPTLLPFKYFLNKVESQSLATALLGPLLILAPPVIYRIWFGRSHLTSFVMRLFLINAVLLVIGQSLFGVGERLTLMFFHFFNGVVFGLCIYNMRQTFRLYFSIVPSALVIYFHRPSQVGFLWTEFDFYGAPFYFIYESVKS